MKAMKSVYVMMFLMLGTLVNCGWGQSIAEKLQNVSVTVRSNNQAEGSGVIITREIEGQKLNFILSAAHIFEGARTVTKVNTSDGTKNKVEFKNSQVIKELLENGTKVGEMTLQADMIRYSDPDRGEDVAVLLLKKRDFINDSMKFYLDDTIPPVGSDVYHCGSMNGLVGQNIISKGIISQIGRMNDGKTYDSYDGGAIGGSSGGTIALASDGRYLGMLVRGYDSVFTMYTPMRRLKAWANDNKMMWLFDESVPPPSMKELKDMDVEVDYVDNSSVPKSPYSDMQTPLMPIFLIR